MSYPPMTIAEAARALGITRQRVHILIHKGLLPATQAPGNRGRWQVDRDAVEARAGLMEVTAHWLTSGDVAKIHGVTIKTVREWVVRGLLPSIRSPQDNNTNLFRPDDVANFVPPRRGRPSA